MEPPTDEDDRIPERAEIYLSTLRELRYIADSTRPDILFATNKLAAATKQPTKRHWALLKRLVRYLKNTRKMGIVYQPAPTRPNLCGFHQPGPKNRYHNFVGYADADFAGDISDKKSTTGTVHLFNNAPIAWQSVKQSMQALSTCEAEYISATTAVQTLQWLRRLLQETRIIGREASPLFVDNQAALLIAKNKAPTKRRKYIDIRYHFLLEHTKLSNITVEHTPSAMMVADIPTKATKPQSFLALRKALRMA